MVSSREETTANMFLAYLQDKLDELDKGLQDKGYTASSVELIWQANGGMKFTLNAYANGDYTGRVYNYFYVIEQSYAGINEQLEEAFHWINELQSVSDRKKEVLLQKISDTIAYAQAQGEDVASLEEIVNPLRELMKKLSENIITDQRKGSESYE